MPRAARTDSLCLLFVYVAAIKCCHFIYRGEDPFRNVGLISYPDASRGEVLANNCSYTILAPEDKVISFRFLRFQFPGANGRTCASYIVMYDSQSPLWTLGCSAGYPSSVTTTSNVLLVNIIVGQQADRHLSFVATYRLVDPYTPCNDSRTLLPGAKGILMSPNFPKVYPGNSQCYMYLKAPSSGYHIQLHFDEHFHLEWTPGCASDYVQVDSNPSGSQHSPATLQTFCGTIVPRPIVSRGDSILVIFASDFKNSFTGFKLTYSVKAEVSCDSRQEFRCSPVECIPRTGLCDGIVQCTNARDEHCGPSSGTPPACFLCGDGECVQPSYPVYGSDMSDSHWWWLCDGYAHCTDGTDETPEVCEQRWSRAGALFWCSSKTDPNSSIAILATWVCDGISHCHRDLDENSASCQVTYIDSSPPDLAAIYIPATIALALLVVVVAFYSYSRLRRKCSGGVSYTNLLVESAAPEGQADPAMGEGACCESGPEQQQHTWL